MARDGSGTYTLPLNAVVTATTITPTWANTTLDDIATELTDSLDRYGRGGLTSAFENLSGSASLPGISYINDPASGYYLAATNEMQAIVGTNKVARWYDDTATGAGDQRPFQVWDGSAWFSPLDPASLPSSMTFGTVTTTGAIVANSIPAVPTGGLNVAGGMAIVGDSDIAGNLTVSGAMSPWAVSPLSTLPSFAMAYVDQFGTMQNSINVTSTIEEAVARYRVNFTGTFEGGVGNGFAIATAASGTTPVSLVLDQQATDNTIKIHPHLAEFEINAATRSAFTILGITV